MLVLSAEVESAICASSAPNENTLPHPFLDDNGINPVYQKDLVRDAVHGFPLVLLF
jgi:hypothetical protein